MLCVIIGDVLISVRPGWIIVLIFFLQIMLFGIVMIPPPPPPPILCLNNYTITARYLRGVAELAI